MYQSTPAILLCQLYSLNQSDSEWVYIDICYVNANYTNEIVLVQKDTRSEVHRHLIRQANQYKLEDDEGLLFTIEEADYALSFQNKSGRDAVWDRIQQALAENQQSDDDELCLTPVNKETLPRIMEVMTQLANSGSQAKQVLQHYILNKKGYLDKLSEVFDQFEKEHDAAMLQIMCTIVKNIVSVAEHELFQVLLSDQYYNFVFGALEYDEEMQKKDFTPHRKFLAQQCTFIQVVAFKSKEKQRLIQFVYRLSYLRDCVLAYYIDEMQLIFIKIVLKQSISQQIIKNCYGELIKYIENSKDFLIEVMDQLRNFNHLALRLLLEICQIFREHQDLNKQLFFQKLSEFGLYDIMEEYLYEYTKGFEKLRSKLKKTKTKLPEEVFQKLPYNVLELLVVCLQYQPNYFRLHIQSEHQQVLKYPLMHLILDQTFNNTDSNLQSQFLDVLKMVIESHEETECVQIFLPIFNNKISSQVSHQSSQNFKLQFMDICLELCRIIKPTIRDAIISGSICQKLSFILLENDKFQQIKCLQLMKVLILSKDEELNNQIRDFIPSLIQFCFRYRRENLIFSQVLELIKIIYDMNNHFIINEIEEDLKNYTSHAHYSRVCDLIRKMKAQAMDTQINHVVHYTAETIQQKSPPELRVDDEIGIFKSMHGHNIKGKKLVDYEEEPSQKKVKKD